MTAPASPATPADAPTSIGRSTPLVSLLLAALCGIVYLFELLRFGPKPGTSELHVAGGFSEGALRAGTWWAPGMHQLMHLDVDHLVGNLFLLLVIGILLEVAWGWGITALVVAVTSITSTIGTWLFTSDYVSVGVSGVIAGLAGFALAQRAPRRINRWLLQLIALGVVLAEAIPPLFEDDGSVDHAGHAGGLLGGILLALVLRLPRLRTPGALHRLRLVGVVLAVGMLVATLVGAAPRYVQIAGYAWHGVGMHPDPHQVPPLELVELAVDGMTLDDGDILLEPDCEAARGDDVTCAVLVRDGDTSRRRDVTIDRRVEHLEFDLDFD